jgi:hypothetical protein
VAWVPHLILIDVLEMFIVVMPVTWFGVFISHMNLVDVLDICYVLIDLTCFRAIALQVKVMDVLVTWIVQDVADLDWGMRVACEFGRCT